MQFTLDTTPPVLVRPMTPADRHLLQYGFDHLSEDSRYYRFLMRRSALTDEELDFLTAANSATHVALGALDIARRKPRPVGVARYVRNAPSEATAEIAITIADRYQGRGIGTAMIGLLAYLATGQGITDFTAMVHAENEKMLSIFRAAGSQIDPARQGEVRVTMPLHADPSSYPANRTGDTIRDHFVLARETLDESG